MTKTQINNQKYQAIFRNGAAPDTAGRKKSLFSFSTLNKVQIFLILAAALCYIATVNDLSVKGIVLQELKKSQTELEKYAENSELKINELRSYEYITAKANEMKMVKVDRIDYVSQNSGQVAIR